MPEERFGEAALNLSQILEDALGIDECFAFASVWMHSRSSTSEQSNMQDYVAPHQIIARSCSASGDKFHDLDADGAARCRRARPSRVDHLGRLRQRRC